jgi:hypothetical protein
MGNSRSASGKYTPKKHFQELHSKYLSKELELKDRTAEFLERIENQHKLMANGIETSIESLKDQLDNLGLGLKNKLANYKQSAIENVLDDQESFESLLYKLKESIDKNQFTQQHLLQAKLNLQKFCEKNFDGLSVVFRQAKENEITAELIGSIYMTMSNEIVVLESFAERDDDVRVIPFNSTTFMFSVRSKTQSLSKLLLADSELKKTKTVITQLGPNQKQFEVFGMASDLNGSIFLVDRSQHQLMKLNENFEVLKSLKLPSMDIYQEWIVDCCVYEQKVYITVPYRSDIGLIAYSFDLRIISMHNIGCKPYRILIVDGIACILCRTPEKETRFYKVSNNFEIVSRYPSCGLMYVFAKRFYQFDQIDSSLYVFDQSGDLLTKSKVDIGNAIVSCFLVQSEQVKVWLIKNSKSEKISKKIQRIEFLTRA